MVGCATKERIPKEPVPLVQVESNPSGIETGTPQIHGAYNLLGAINVPPDVPPGATVSILSSPPLHYEPGRYFVAASGRLDIVNIERMAAYDTKYHSYADDLRYWRALLDHPPANDWEARHILEQNRFLEIPWANAARSFHAKLRYKTFPWGKAILFLTAYVQDDSQVPVNNAMLVLTVQGLTSDGRYAVNAHFKIRHSELPESPWDKHLRGKAVFDISKEDVRAEQWFDAQPDDSFEPTFQQCETFLTSVRIAPASR